MRDGWDGLHSVLKCLRESSFEALLPRPRRILPRLLSLVGEEAREGDNKVARHRMNGIQPILSFWASDARFIVFLQPTVESWCKPERRCNIVI